MENEIAGMGIFLKSFNKNEVFFFSFALKKKFQGKGLGRFFFGKTVEYIFENYSDIKSIKLTVDPLIPKNIKLFKSFGFSEIQYFKNFYGNGIDRIYMELKREYFKI
jgi:ribosomal protein S18 acetylase RimI-like enzyme